MSTLPEILLTDRDRDRLSLLVASHSGALAERLDEEAARARVVPQKLIPPDVVTMNSEVTYEDCLSGVQRTIRLVFPEAADMEGGKVSILSPMGAALLGLRVGNTIRWQTPRGFLEFRVHAIPYQPEAAGDYNL